jgi:hypothetical protein
MDRRDPCVAPPLHHNLIPNDQGQPLTDIVSRLRYAKLRRDCRQMLQTLEPLERRVVRNDTIRHGTIVTFVDVTRIVQAEQHQRCWRTS